MTKRGQKNVAASTRARLLTLARGLGRPYNEVEQYYAMERFLFRLGASRVAGQFVLKGAMMLRVWGDSLGRATRDIDLLGKGQRNIDDVVRSIKECLNTPVDDDGVSFDAETVTGEDIRAQAKYAGVRVHVEGKLGNGRLKLQIDVGFGDVITPGPVTIDYPQLLDFGEPHLASYTAETAIAEKFEAMVALGELNTRMKDFYDVVLLAAKRDFDGAVLAAAIKATFDRRGTEFPLATPLAFLPAFATAPTKPQQWSAFLKRLGVHDGPESLVEATDCVRIFLDPVRHAIARGASFGALWKAGSQQWHF